jgi:hypothetical protein
VCLNLCGGPDVKTRNDCFQVLVMDRGALLTLASLCSMPVSSMKSIRRPVLCEDAILVPRVCVGTLTLDLLSQEGET